MADAILPKQLITAGLGGSSELGQDHQLCETNKFFPFLSVGSFTSPGRHQTEGTSIHNAVGAPTTKPLRPTS